MAVKVVEISNKGAATLIEWNDGTVHRVSVPSFLVDHDEGIPTVENPEEGVPYGELWEDLVEMVNPERVAGLLREAGIWTYEDFLHNTAAVNSAFRAASGESYQKFVQAVHSRQRIQPKE